MSHRSEQVASELYKALSRVLNEHQEYEKFGLITVTDVIVKGKLDHAIISISSLEYPHDLCEKLQQKSQQLRHQIKGLVQLRKIPQLSFAVDETYQILDKIDEAS